MANLQTTKTPMPEQEANVRNGNFLEVALGYTLEQAQNEAQRCLNCKNKPCVSGCPVGIPIPDFLAKVAEGDIAAAYEILSNANALPAISGRVCPQESQCEGKCVRCNKGDSVGIGRVERGEIKAGQQVAICGGGEEGHKNAKISKLYQFEGLKRVEAESAKLGDIIAVSGIANLNIGETACAADCIEPLPFVKIDEPTVSMLFKVNDSPFAGREGKFVTSRNLRDRLFKEVETNVAMRVEETDSMDTFKVSGRGELHLSILIEQMRRGGYEFQVSPPTVIYKEKDGKKLEPMELLMIETPDSYVGAVMEKIGARKAELVNMGSRETGITHMEFRIPARGLMGYRSEFLAGAETAGRGVA